jgi:hypothetical protein
MMVGKWAERRVQVLVPPALSIAAPHTILFLLEKRALVQVLAGASKYLHSIRWPEYFYCDVA